jgi:hypothetical protein
MTVLTVVGKAVNQFFGNSHLWAGRIRSGLGEIHQSLILTQVM